MFDPTIATKLLNWLLNVNWSTNNGQTTNPAYSQLPTVTDLYLALYTTMPTVSSSGVLSGGVEVSGGNYARQRLTKVGLGDSKILSAVDFVQRRIKVYDDRTETWGDEETSYVPRVRNHQEEIHFPNTGETGSGYGSSPVVGVGIFTALTGGTLLMTGKLIEPVTFDQPKYVPVILADNIEFTLI